MCGEKDKLDYRKKIRTYAKRLVTVFSVTLGIVYIVYIATWLFHISGFSLHFAIAGTILSVISLALNTWSLTDHFQNLKQKTNKETGMENSPEQKNLLRICLDIASSASFFGGGVTSLISNIVTLSFYGASIIPFVSASLFIIGYAIMGVNIVRWLIDSGPQTQENNNVKIDQLSFPKVGQEA